MLLQENGYLYPHEYLIQMAEEGQELFFLGMKEERDWRIALALFGEYEEDYEDE